MDMTEETRRKHRLARFSESAGLWAVLFVLVILFGLVSEHFWSVATFNQIANQVPALAVIAVGMTFVILTAGIDLSVGAVMAFSGAILGLAMVDWSLPLWLAVLLAILAGLACGCLNGSLTVFFRVPSFIVTLGMMQIARGLAYLATGSQTTYIGKPVEWISAPIPRWGFSPAFVTVIFLVTVGQIVLHRTTFGRYVRVIGANEDAAIYSGIRIRPIKIAVFILAGALAGLAALFDSSKLGAVDPNAGTGLELSAIAAVVIGGTSLMGGRGSVVGSFIGVLIIATLGTGLAQIGATEPLKLLITGLVIVAAVVIDAWKTRKMQQSTS